jgi:hypothetical protein
MLCDQCKRDCPHTRVVCCWGQRQMPARVCDDCHRAALAAGSPSQAKPDRTTDADGPPFDPEDRFGNNEYWNWVQALEAEADDDDD